MLGADVYSTLLYVRAQTLCDYSFLQFTHFVHLLTVILSCSHDKVFTQTLHFMYKHSFGEEC